MAWWRDARFGLFIHWGPVSLTGEEISWSRTNTNPKCPNHGPTSAEAYDNLYKRFDPVNFNANEWADIAKEGGMKYVVLTAKHCDGFLLWHSKVDPYNIEATPFKRDVCAELAKAVRHAGLHLGWYFSPMDWRDPDFRTDLNAIFVEKMQGEIAELLSNYGTVDLMWFDTDGHENAYDVANTYRIVKALQPSILIDNRLDMGSEEAYQRQEIIPPGDYYTPEQRIGAYDDQRPWETCMTLGTQWSWKPEDKIKSAKEVVDILARCVGGDGNLLLNVGPMPDGRIEPRQVDVLKHVGKWLLANGRSIYGTRGGPWKATNDIASTRCGNTIYVHVLNAANGKVSLPDLPAKVESASLVHGQRVDVEQTATTLDLTIPESGIDPLDTVVTIKLDRPATTIPAIDVH